MTRAALSQPLLTSAQLRPASLSIDEHPPLANDPSQERWVALSVAQLDQIDLTTDAGFKLGAEIQDALEVTVAQLDQEVHVAVLSIPVSGHRAEQHDKADVWLGAQLRTQSSQQRPLSPDVISLGYRHLKRARGPTNRAQRSFVDRPPQRALAYADILSDELKSVHASIMPARCVRSGGRR